MYTGTCTPTCIHIQLSIVVVSNCVLSSSDNNIESVCVCGGGDQFKATCL